jgi:hypothetical protein
LGFFTWFNHHDKPFDFSWDLMGYEWDLNGILIWY